MATLTAALKVVASTTYTGASDLSTLQDVLSQSFSNALTSGTGANQGDLLFHDQRTLTASSTEDLDLTATIDDPLGNALSFVKLKAIIVIAASGNTNNVVVGGATAALAAGEMFSDTTDEVVVHPGGMFALTAPDADGIAVTATTADLIKVANSAGGTSVTYDVILIGTSA